MASEESNYTNDEQAYPVTNSGVLPHAKKRFVRSIRWRASLNYLLYSIILLFLLWVVFFIFLFSVYASMQETDLERVGDSVAQTFPEKADSRSLELYRNRLRETASAQEIAMAVFTMDGDELDLIFAVDSMGNVMKELFMPLSSVADVNNLESIYAHAGKVCKIQTADGIYMCHGTAHDIEDGQIYLLVMKKYNLFNHQVMQLITVLIICTVIVLALSILFSVLASKVQTRQIAEFSDKVKRMAAGDFNVRFTGNGVNEYDNLANALNAAKDEIEKAERMQRELVANVSHEIRTPLTMIRAYAEMLRDMPVDDKKRKKTADVIIAESERLNVLVNDILNMSKLQAGVVEYGMELCDVAEIAEATLLRFEIFRTRDGIKFDKHIERSAVATCDRQKIEQVLYNLLINAINYSGEDKTVILNVKKTNDGVRVEVGDHGKGISPDELDSVWDRYYRAVRNKRSTVGSGLGLSISKTILIGHNARYGVESELGKGSTFWFELTCEA